MAGEKAGEPGALPDGWNTGPSGPAPAEDPSRWPRRIVTARPGGSQLLLAVLLAGLMDRHDVRMAQLGRIGRLGPEPPHVLCRGHPPVPQQLHGRAHRLREPLHRFRRTARGASP